MQYNLLDNTSLIGIRRKKNTFIMNIVIEKGFAMHILCAMLRCYIIECISRKKKSVHLTDTNQMKRNLCDKDLSWNRDIELKSTFAVLLLPFLSKRLFDIFSLAKKG